MTGTNTSNELIHLINSDEKILQVLKQSNEYLETNGELSARINEIVWIHRSLTDLIPQTMENFVSGHATILEEQCSESTFSQTNWAESFGC